MDDRQVMVSRRVLKRIFAGACLGLTGLASLFGVIAWNAAGQRPSRLIAHVAPPPPVAHLDLTVAVGLGPSGDWPAYIPSDFTVPAHSTVVVTIVDLDDATALPATYSKVSGTVGDTVDVRPIDPANPNGVSGTDSVVSALNPVTQVGHTFTIPELGLNVPVAAHSRETFTIKTGAAGVYNWHCYDPCGMGKTGWMGPMGPRGYMGGTMTVAA